MAPVPPGMVVTSVRPRTDRPPCLPPTLVAQQQQQQQQQNGLPGKAKKAAEAVPAPAAATGKRPKKKKEKKLPQSTLDTSHWKTMGGTVVGEAAVLEMGAGSTPGSLPVPRWPPALASRGPALRKAVLASGLNLAGCEAILRALRLSLTAQVKDQAWLAALRRRLAAVVAAAVVGDDEDDPDVDLFQRERGDWAPERARRKGGPDADSSSTKTAKTTAAKSGGKPSSASSSSSVTLKNSNLLERAELDVLHFALWSFARRRRANGGDERFLHPADLAVEAEELLFREPRTAASLRKLLQGLPTSMREAWGLRQPWLQNGSGSIWEEGASKIVRLLRARWCEVAAVAAEIGSLKTSDIKVRRGFMDWHFASRDCCARWLSFSLPSKTALASIKNFAGAAGVVELGAGNGLWASLLAAEGVPIDAYDTAPPHESIATNDDDDDSEVLKVEQGTADDLVDSKRRVLLLCMPPPGEEGCADYALAQFPRDRVAYVGEWCSGMTGTRSFHQTLLKDYDLVSQLDLPTWFQTRIGLYLFQKKSAAASSPSEASGQKRKRASSKGPTTGKKKLKLKKKKQRTGAQAASEDAADEEEKQADNNNDDDGGDDNNGEAGEDKKQDKKSNEEGGSNPKLLGACCDVCGARDTEAELWKCPWTRQFCVCSDECYEEGEPQHRAILEATFCGASVPDRPELETWTTTRWVEFGEPGTTRLWDALKVATPQAEQFAISSSL